MRSLPYLKRYTDRHGKQRYYFRRKGAKRVALPGKFGSPEFLAAYHAALSGSELPPTIESRAAEGTFRKLAEEYFGSPEFKMLADGTRPGYRSSINGFLREYGHLPVAGFRYKHMLAIMGKMADRPAAANNLLDRVRTLMKLAIRLEWITADPTTGIKPYKKGSFHTWTEDEIEQFRSFFPLGTFERTAFEIHLNTGQRRSDVATMGWPALKGSSIEVVASGADADEDEIDVVQKKTGASVTIPIHADLRAALDVWPRKHVTILYGQQGRPLTIESYGNYMREALRAAGLPARCKLHGLRKATARRLAEAGCTTQEIMSITGHKTLAEVERYTREVNRKKLARAGMDRLASTKPEQEVSNLSPKSV